MRAEKGLDLDALHVADPSVVHQNHEASMDAMNPPHVRAPEFPVNLDWINTGGRALTLEDLRGKIAILDFWV